jgi:regulator of protease activity HflC (stomatin/prohibitin superfamily)
LEPGINIINPITETVIAIDLRTKVGALPKQPILTKDNVTVVL